MFVLVGCTSVDQETAEIYAAKAEDVILLLNEQNFEELYQNFDEKMSTDLTVQEMETHVAPVIEESGEFQSFDQFSVENKQGYYVVVVGTKYSDVNRVYTITFDQQEKIAGLYVK